MNADFFQEAGIEQQLKELTTLIESLHKERAMLTASENILQEPSEKTDKMN